MTIRQLPSARWTVPGTSGGIAAGWYVYTYIPSTTTAKATYTDYTGNTPNSNPIVLDSRGEANIWWDGVYKVLVYTGDKDNGGALVWSQDNYGEGTTSVLQGNFNLVLNGSFEQDTNGDGVPDDWDVVEYTDGEVSLDTTDQAHGAQSLKFVSSGTGGGYATSAFFEVEGSKVVPVSFAIKASVATVHNQVDIVWYTAAQAVISTTTLYDDTATNPTDWTAYSYNSTAPATARYGKVRVYGCKDDDAQAGTTWFDNVRAEVATALQGWFSSVNGTVTATDEELNILHGVTASTDELNVLDGVTASAAEINILDGAAVIGWHIRAAVYLGKMVSVSAQVDVNADIAFSSDGTKMYILDSTPNTVFQYSLSTAWDVSTASYSSKNFDVTAQETSPNGIAFSSDGTKMYVSGLATDAAYQYTLGVAWDVSTSSYASKSLSVAAQDSAPTGIAFSADGTKMYVVGTANDTVFQYDLSIAWDLSTATYATKSLSTSAEETAPGGAAFSTDGKRMFLVGSNRATYEYHLATAWDVSTGAYSGVSLPMLAEETSNIDGIAFNENGTKLYVCGVDSQSVIQYSCGIISV